MKILSSTRPSTTAVITAPAASGRYSRPTWRGLYSSASTSAVSTVAETDAAAANRATMMPAIGMVLVSISRIVSSGLRARYW